MECTRNRKRGFTLIELMVVILIIAILATLATMAGSAAIRAAKQARIKTELDNIAGQIEVYKSEYGSYPPNTTAQATPTSATKVPAHKIARSDDAAQRSHAGRGFVGLLARLDGRSAAAGRFLQSFSEAQ